jgi:hypothetical protein
MDRLSYSFILLSILYSISFGGWTKSNVPNMQPIMALANIGDKVFAGTYGAGLFKSSNNGLTWDSVVTAGIYNKNIRCISVSGSRIFVSGYYCDLSYSIDSGKTWLIMNDGFGPKKPYSKNYSTRSLAVNGNVIFVGTDSGLYKTSLYTNYLNNIAYYPWTKMFNYTIDNSIYPVVGWCNNVLYWYTDEGIRISKDTCKTALVGDKTIAYDSSKYAGKISVNSFMSMGNRMIIGNDVNYYDSSYPISYYSDDNGSTWLKPTGFLWTTGSINCFAKYNNILFAGCSGQICMSIDSGKTWKSINLGIQGVTSESTTFYAGYNRVKSLTCNGKYLFASITSQNYDSSSLWIRPLSELMPTAVINKAVIKIKINKINSYSYNILGRKIQSTNGLIVNNGKMIIKVYRSSR